MPVFLLPEGLGNIVAPDFWWKPCSPRQWGNAGSGVLAVDVPPLLTFPFFETPAGLVPDGQGGVFLLSTSRTFWIVHTLGFQVLKHFSPSGAAGPEVFFGSPQEDAGVIGTEPQAALVPSGGGRCIVLWGWHQSQMNLVAQRFDTAGNGLWKKSPTLVSQENYEPNTTNSLVAESDGNGGAIVAWISFTTSYYSVRAQSIQKTGDLRWPGGVTWAPGLGGVSPNSWLQIVPGKNVGEAIVVVPEFSKSEITHRAYRIDAGGSVAGPTDLTGLVPDSGPSYLRARTAVTDGKGGLYFAYVDSASALHLLRFRPNMGVIWDQTLGVVANAHAFHVREDGKGGVIVAWMTASLTPQLKLQRIAASGSITWGAQLGGASLQVLAPPASATWLPDDWACAAQAVPTPSGGATLVFADFSSPGQVQKLFSVCFDSSGTQQGPIEDVSSRVGPQTLPLVVPVDRDVVTAWSDESVGNVGSDVWVNRSGCCPPNQDPYQLPFPCAFPDLSGMKFGEIPFFLTCGDATLQFGVYPLMKLARDVVGLDVPGSLTNRSAAAPAWMRLIFRGLPPGTSIQLCSSKGRVLASSRKSPTGVSLTFAPTSGPEDALLVFTHKGPAQNADPIAVRVEGSWGEGEAPPLPTGRPRLRKAARGRVRRNERRR